MSSAPSMILFTTINEDTRTATNFTFTFRSLITTPRAMICLRYEQHFYSGIILRLMMCDTGSADIVNNVSTIVQVCTKEVEDDEEVVEEDTDKPKIEEVEVEVEVGSRSTRDDKLKNKKTKKIKEQETLKEELVTMKPIWTRNPSEITGGHFSVEGQLEFQTILFILQRAPSEIAEDKDNFTKFYETFGKNLKLSNHEDAQNRSKLTEFLHFFSTKSTEVQMSLKNHHHHPHAEIQKLIYYLGESLASVRDSPFLEVLVNPISEYAITQLHWRWRRFIVVARST
ncbi:Hsp90 protein-domain-containing protein [Mycena metata]|uniref:Hsp90 protein-domain-containing protein n=1 Tax=Mycena metata TaxID=1033252 RepID=A0AAD7JLX7_9AGAR|nr:Hsp90 protein-domain-containing protein [Mycena metata]